VFSQTYGITEAVQKVSEAYKCKPIEGMLSHQLKQFKIDGEKTIIQNPNDAQKKEHEKFEIGPHEVYAMDVLISTGEGVVSSSLFIRRNSYSNFAVFLLCRVERVTPESLFSRKQRKPIS